MCKCIPTTPQWLVYLATRTLARASGNRPPPDRLSRTACAWEPGWTQNIFALPEFYYADNTHTADGLLGPAVILLHSR